MNIYTKSFGYKCCIFQSPYIAMIDDLLTKPPEKTKYYSYLYGLLLSFPKPIWGYINTTKDIVKRVEVFKEIVLSIQKNGFQNKEEIVYSKGKPYGKITVKVTDEGIQVIDGHHRISTLIWLGVKEFELIDNLYLLPKKYKQWEKTK